MTTTRRTPATLILSLVWAVACGDDSSSVDASMGDAQTDAPSCAPGTFDDDRLMATACIPWTECGAGEYAVPGSATEDRECVPCVNSFSTGVNAAGCTAWADCPPGEFVSGAGSTTSDRTCSACADGTFSAAPNADACAAYTACAPGTYIAEDGSADVDQVCADCEVGTFSDSENAESCTPYSLCEAGEFREPAGTATMDGGCAECAAGTFSDSENANACAPWSTCDLFLVTAGSAETDAVCGEPCADMSDADDDGIPDTCAMNVLLVEGFGADPLAGFLTGWGFSVVRIDGSALVADFDYSPYDVVALMVDSAVADLGSLLTANAAPGGPGIVAHRADAMLAQLGIADSGAFQAGATTVRTNVHYITARLPLGPIDLGHTLKSEARMPISGFTTVLINSPAPALVTHDSERRVMPPYYGDEDGTPWTHQGAQVTWRSYVWAAFSE